MKMKSNQIREKGATKRMVCIVAGLVVLTAIAIAIYAAYSQLRTLWIDQCQIVDVARQVKVHTGKHILPGVILERFGLKKGANLALIDFRGKREEILRDIPNIRELKVERHLPDRVEIAVEERVPIARLRPARGKVRLGGNVVDDEGVVFERYKGINLLPEIICEGGIKNPIVAGKRLTGRTRAALSLLQLSRSARYLDMPVNVADTTPIDFIKLVLGNNDIVRIEWESMDEPTSATQDSLEKVYNQLYQAVKTKIATSSGPAPRPLVWTAIPGNQIYANTKEPIQ